MLEETKNTQNNESQEIKDETQDDRVQDPFVLLKQYGYIFIGLGIIHLLFPYFSLKWGYILIGLGLASLYVKSMFMFFMIGGGLMIVGIMNISFALSNNINWILPIGIVQLGFGGKECGRWYMSL